MTISRSEQIAQLEKRGNNLAGKVLPVLIALKMSLNSRGSVNPEHTLARRRSKAWSSLNGKSKKGYVNALGALTGGQALPNACKAD